MDEKVDYTLSKKPDAPPGGESSKDTSRRRRSRPILNNYLRYKSNRFKSKFSLMLKKCGTNSTNAEPSSSAQRENHPNSRIIRRFTERLSHRRRRMAAARTRHADSASGTSSVVPINPPVHFSPSSHSPTAAGCPAVVVEPPQRQSISAYIDADTVTLDQESRESGQSSDTKGSSNSKSRSKAAKDTGNRIACPFFWICSTTNEHCASIVMYRLGDVKTHIMRQHMFGNDRKAGYWCNTCHIRYSKKKQLQHHTKANACIAYTGPLKVITKQRVNEIYSGCAGLKGNQLYKGIWRQLRPGELPEPSQYLDLVNIPRLSKPKVGNVSAACVGHLKANGVYPHPQISPDEYNDYIVNLTLDQLNLRADDNPSMKDMELRLKRSVLNHNSNLNPLYPTAIPPSSYDMSSRQQPILPAMHHGNMSWSSNNTLVSDLIDPTVMQPNFRPADDFLFINNPLEHMTTIQPLIQGMSFQPGYQLETPRPPDAPANGANFYTPFEQPFNGPSMNSALYSQSNAGNAQKSSQHQSGNQHQQAMQQKPPQVRFHPYNNLHTLPHANAHCM